jgi:NADP-dependent 3-hydroxy acid dehydrogenase YdfG
VRGDAAGAAPGGLRCPLVPAGFTDTDFISSTRNPDGLASLTARRDAIAMPAQAVAENVAFAIALPESVDIGELMVRPTVQP